MRNTMKNKMKKPSLKKLKDKLTKTVELYVRWRDDWTCITCGKRVFNDTKLIHAGHYVGRGCLALKHDLFNVNAQCRGCNFKEHLKGDKNPYSVALVKKYGPDILNYFEDKKHNIVKLDREYMELTIADLEKKIEALKLLTTH